jgi:hypothetical protein
MPNEKRKAANESSLTCLKALSFFINENTPRPIKIPISKYPPINRGNSGFETAFKKTPIILIPFPPIR